MLRQLVKKVVLTTLGYTYTLICQYLQYKFFRIENRLLTGIPLINTCSFKNEKNKSFIKAITTHLNFRNSLFSLGIIFAMTYIIDIKIVYEVE